LLNKEESYHRLILSEKSIRLLWPKMLGNCNVRGNYKRNRPGNDKLEQILDLEVFT